MIPSNYKVEHYVNPGTTYQRLSDKVKLGQLVLNGKNRKIEIVDLGVLEKILVSEKNNEEKVYFPIPLTSKWLTIIFHFEEKYLVPQNLIVFTSKVHGLKIHLQNHQFRIGYIIRETTKGSPFSGTSTTKPLILTVNELLDHFYLLKREQFQFSEEDLSFLNKEFKEDLSEY